MKRTNLLNTIARPVLTAAIAVGLVAAAAAQPGGGYGPPYGMGPAMMGEYGMGPGMMGPGMMGPGMMGPGMMGSYLGLDLNADQRTKIAQIQEESRKKHWDLMGRMREEHYKLQELYYAPSRDPAAIGSQEKKVAELRGQMVQSHVETQNRVEAILTKEQKDRIRNSGRGWMMRGY